MSGGPLLWDVDTQVDFMLPAGKLYVPGADETRGPMARLVRGARAAGLVHVASADDHELTDPEISTQPDFEATYPAHCLRGTEGAAKIAETAQADPLPLGLIPYPPALLQKLVHGRREILLLKKSYSVFTNPSAEPLLELLAPSEIVVFGVATDVCNHAAIMGMLGRGYRVAFVEDAARGLSDERVERCTAVWRDRGVRFTTVADVLAGW
jgi:nicotinamidase/pyrazinamidase